MPLSRCIHCQKTTASRKAVCDYCGYLKSILPPKTGSSIPFIVTLAIVLSLGFYIASSRSYGGYCDPLTHSASADDPVIDTVADYCAPLPSR